MSNSPVTLMKVKEVTNRAKVYPYEEYYFNESEEREKHGEKIYDNVYWSGGESLEWYKGPMVCNTMHGHGTYRCRYSGPAGEFATYEGKFYANRFHGYGTMSYPDGRTFSGLYYNCSRWGPGIERHTNLTANVGIWRGNQLIRLAWDPQAPQIIPDFDFSRNYFDQYRIVLKQISKRVVDKKNSKNSEGAEKNTDNSCDIYSKLCNIDILDKKYYENIIETLEPVFREMSVYVEEEISETNAQSIFCKPHKNEKPDESQYYYAWNNNTEMVKIMQHCFTHHKQRKLVDINFETVLSGPRTLDLSPASHELLCRTLLLSCYVGNISNVVRLVNERNVYSDVADCQGNTTLMYAACAEQTEIIHFLIGAGANVNSYNDCCCTPLGIVLLRYACLCNDVSPQHTVDATAVCPSHFKKSDITNVPEWCIRRKNSTNKQQNLKNDNMRREMSINISDKRTKGVINTNKKMSVANLRKKFGSDSETMLFDDINDEYIKKASLSYVFPKTANLPTSNKLFEVGNLTKDVEDVDKNPVVSKRNFTVPFNSRTSIVGIRNTTHDSQALMDSELKVALATSIITTIQQLLADGADPNLVKFPQTALFMAFVSMNPELILILVGAGADINEIYNDMRGYTILDIAISYPITKESVSMIEAILKCKADTSHKLSYKSNSPSDEDVSKRPGAGLTLLHAVIGLINKVVDIGNFYLYVQVLDLLLEHKCDSTVRFNGKSAVAFAMDTNFILLQVFIRNVHRVNLNAVIDDENQTILTKLFNIGYFKSIADIEKSKILIELLHYGADPFLKCQEKETVFDNLFAYTKKSLDNTSMSLPTTVVRVPKQKSMEKNPVSIPVNARQSLKPDMLKLPPLDLEQYIAARNLLIENSRLLYIKWIQGNLVKGILNVLYRFKHRLWPSVIKELKNKKSASVWLDAQRSYDIWKILRTKRQAKGQYKDERILKSLLCIVEFYSQRSAEREPFLQNLIIFPMTAPEKESIESKVSLLIRDQKIIESHSPKLKPWEKLFTKPELLDPTEPKFNVCFHCFLPFYITPLGKITCKRCKLVTFCSKNCLIDNVFGQEENSHPCTPYLKHRYAVPEESMESSENTEPERTGRKNQEAE